LRVGLDASVVFSSVGGTRTYAVELITAMLRERPDWRFILYARDPGQADELRAMWPANNAEARVVGGSPNTLRLQSRLPGALAEDRVDLYHSLGYFLPLRWRGPKVVTMHDMNVYASWRRWLRPKKIVNWADMAVQIPFAARAASRIVTDSGASKELIVQILHVDAEKVSVIPLAADDFFAAAPSADETAEAARVAGGDRYVLFVGIISAQKNLGLLVRAFAASGIARDGCRLVLAGSDREGEGAALRRLATSAGAGDSLVVTEFVSRPVLRALYHGAMVTVLPSHGEGFGLPLVEAMAAGCPVVAARTQSLPEVLGDGGELFAPDDVDALARLLARLAHDEAYHDDLAARALARRASFAWTATARATAAVYEEVLSSPR
jgi:glycosyltransferase involved in cell wall biosynthesis